MSRPPKGADRLLWRSVRRTAVAASIIGDLHEEHGALRVRRGWLVGALWYWLQVLRIAAGYRFGLVAETGGGSPRPRWRDDLLLDARLALRGVRRNPSLAGVVVLSLALAVGANATMYGVIDRLLLSAPPQIEEPRDVVRLSLEVGGYGGDMVVMEATSWPVFEDLRDHATSFADWAAVAPAESVLGNGEDAAQVVGSAVSGSYFSLLGTRPQIGRFINETDDRPPHGSPVAVISYGLWQREFAGEAGVLGREILVDGAPHAVVGVAPVGFNGDGLAPIDLWLPIHSAFAGDGVSWMSDRRRRLLSVIGRLGGGDLDAALAEADLAVQRGAEGAGMSEIPRARLAPLTPGRGPQGTSTQARISLWLGGVTFVVLLVAVANAANLLLLRAQQRHHELRVRLALGMGRGRLLRQTLTEATLLALAGGIGALLLATWAGSLLRAWLMPETAAPATYLGPGVAAATSLATVGAALLVGLLPVLHLAFRAGAPAAIAARPDSAQGTWLRNALLVAQTAMSVVLLVGAGLFVTSLSNVQGQDLGLRLEGVLLAEIRFSAEVAGGDRDALYRETLQRVRRIPGVELASAAQAIPFGSFATLRLGFPGKDFRALFEGRQVPYYHAVEPPFFELMGVDVVAGRALRPSDDAAAPPVMVISESLARYVWPDESALGKCVRAGMVELPSPDTFMDGAGDEVPCYEVVGVAADVQERSLLPEFRLTMQWYTTFEQMPPTPPMMSDARWVRALLVKTVADPSSVAGAVRRVMQGSSDRIAFVDVRPYRDLIDPRTRSWRLGATLFSAFGGLALAIATVGMYAVFAYAAAQRSHEMGVRMALGARRADVARLVIGRSLRAVAAGIALGGAASLWAARYIEDLLFETGARDPGVLVTVASLLAAVALIASALPAWRAARTDPKVSLAES